ncbi:MAG TPA: polyprenol phosphomannose-dependent alpha 1,6 mannosyltransferase MptB [Actinomycetaceae bacterium]|nr:polyprenol phosphomannose-dependent alpha 1,6 mannosyltransferase MptB [Actinomycetaceae bacterium]
MTIQLPQQLERLDDTLPGVRSRVVLGFVFSLIIALGSWGSGAVLEPYIASLAPGFELTSRTGGSPLAATITMAGLVGMVWVWWGLRNRGVTASQWAWIILLWAAPLLIAAPLQSRDMYSYAAQGQLLHEGLSPYTNAVRDMDSDWVRHTSAVWLVSPSPYGPFFLMIARAAAMISGGNILVALAVFRLSAVVALVATTWGVSEISRRLGLAPERASMIGWLALANPFVLTQVVAGGHNDALTTALIVVAVLFAWNKRLAAASIAVALAAMVKVTAVIALPFVALLWLVVARPVTFRNLVSALLRSVGYAMIPAVLLSLGLGLGFDWVIPVDGLEEGISPSLVSAVGVVIGTLGGLLGGGFAAVESTVAIAQSLGVLAMMVALVVTFVVLAGRVLVDAGGRSAADPGGVSAANTGWDTTATIERIIQGLAVGLTITVALAPTIRVWYILWFLPVAALVLTEKRLITALAVLTTFATIWVLPDGNSVNFPALNPMFIVIGVALMGFLVYLWQLWTRNLAADSKAVSSAILRGTTSDPSPATVTPGEEGLVTARS